MAIKQFAIPLDEQSIQQGERNFKELTNAGMSAEFQLTNVSSTTASAELNLITKKNGAAKSHVFNAAVSGGKASVTLQNSDLSTVYNDANGGDLDYVEANWSTSQVDTPNKSKLIVNQGGGTYNLYDWPPN